MNNVNDMCITEFNLVDIIKIITSICPKQHCKYILCNRKLVSAYNVNTWILNKYDANSDMPVSTCYIATTSSRM